jgi:hypothetical protein
MTDGAISSLRIFSISLKKGREFVALPTTDFKQNRSLFACNLTHGSDILVMPAIGISQAAMK